MYSNPRHQQKSSAAAQRCAQQVPEVLVSILDVMSSREFAEGVADVRAGRRPRFDEVWDGCAWDYERGRQFGVIAPRSLPIFEKKGRRGCRSITARALALYREWVTL